jgi:hypothetical protein
MIKINLLDPQKQELNAAVAEFLEIARNGSYSQRHPELGKMIACQVCGRRHRSARVCLPVYGRVAGTENEKGEVTISTKKQALGAAVFKGKRILKHRNAWGLQVLERATLLFREWRADPYQFTTPDDELGKHALSRSLNEKRSERAADRKTRMARTRESRRVNRGL